MVIACFVYFQFSPQSCPTLCHPMDCSTPGLPVYHQLPELAQTHVLWVSDTIQPSHPLSSPAFSSSLQSFPASGSFPRSQFFTSGGQSIGVSASASVFPMNIQDWFPWGWTGWISLQSKGLSRIFSSTTVDFFYTVVCIFDHNKNHLKKIQQVRINKIIWGGERNILSLTWLKNYQCKVGKSRPEGVFLLLFSSPLQTRYLAAPRLDPLGHHWGVYLCGSKVCLSLFCVWVRKCLSLGFQRVSIYVSLCVCLCVCPQWNDQAPITVPLMKIQQLLHTSCLFVGSHLCVSRVLSMVRSWYLCTCVSHVW